MFCFFCSKTSLRQPSSQITNGFIGSCGFESLVASNTLLSHNLHTGPRQLNLLGISESHPFYSTVSTVSTVLTVLLFLFCFYSPILLNRFYCLQWTVVTLHFFFYLGWDMCKVGVMIRRENLDNISRSVFVDSLLRFVFLRTHMKPLSIHDL